MGVRIRQVVLDVFRGQYLNAAKAMKDEYHNSKTRKNSSVPCTVRGKGFTKGQDLAVVKANDRRIEEKKEAKVSLHDACMFTMSDACMSTMSDACIFTILSVL